MFVLQKSKLYISKAGFLTGVSISSGGEITHHPIKEMPDGTGQNLSLYEVMCKFGIYDGGSYEFPIEVEQVVLPIKEVKKDEPIVTVQKPVRKYTKRK